MKNSILHFLVLSISLVFLQVTIFNNVGIWGFANPYIYILFVLLLPIDVKGWILLLSAFFLGLVMDMFGNTPGLHTASTLTMAFVRPFSLRLISGRTDFDPGSIPLLAMKGQRWIFTYIFLLVLIHHMLLFFLEVFHFRAFFLTLFTAILTAAISSLLIILGVYLIAKPSKRGR